MTIALEDRDEKDGRLFSPSAGRNRDVIAEYLAEQLTENARVLEIASGTGEHAVAVLERRPNLHWQMSDPDARSRESEAAWLRHHGLDQPQPLALDVSRVGWASDLAPVDAIFCANMIHIAPIKALHGLAEGAAQIIATEGSVTLYGPFLFGEASAPSNLSFDANLKARNPAWGVRESDFVKHIFAKHGFNRSQMREMPKNNHIFEFFLR